VLQGAIVMMSADSGDIVALVGGRSYAVSPFNRATQALRQMGSVFKPVVYAAAFASGIDPDDLVSDEPVTVDMGDETWTPKNFDSQGADTITVADALIHSRNRATVRVALAAGLQSVQATALRLGFTDLPHVPSVVLGAADSRVLTVTSAYTAFAREDGQRVVPRLVTRVLDAHGQVLFQASVTTVPALTPDVARTVRQLLQAAVNHGTGASVRNWFSGAAAGKTGTTNDGNDVWFVGATPHYVASVWVGFDRPRTILGGNEGTGGRIAAPIWGRLMKAYLGRDASTWKNTPRITESSDSTEADSAAFPSQANDSVAVPDTTQ
jgi:penicillin-binding protein 1A